MFSEARTSIQDKSSNVKTPTVNVMVEVNFNSNLLLPSTHFSFHKVWPSAKHSLIKVTPKTNWSQKCMTDHKNIQFSNSSVFRTTDLILLKLEPFCSEWFALWADKFSLRSVTSGNMAVWSGKEWSESYFWDHKTSAFKLQEYLITDLPTFSFHRQLKWHGNHLKCH